MFELRILKRKVPCKKAIPGFFCSKIIDWETTIDVLQYRAGINYEDGPDWGEWKDVPTVEEET